MWETIRYYMLNVAVAPREGRVSRNLRLPDTPSLCHVAPREGRVSKKFYIWFPLSPLMYVLSRFIWIKRK